MLGKLNQLKAKKAFNPVMKWRLFVNHAEGYCGLDIKITADTASFKNNLARIN